MMETIAKRKDRHIVVCIDEFQQVGEFTNSKSFQARLRSVWQHHHYTSYCLYGSKRHMMSKIFLDRSMPFYQFGDLLWLQKIPTADWIDYIISHFEEAGRHISIRSNFDLGSPSNIDRLRKALIERDLIYSEMKKLFITDPLFNLWFRKRFT